LANECVLSRVKVESLSPEEVQVSDRDSYDEDNAHEEAAPVGKLVLRIRAKSFRVF